MLQQQTLDRSSLNNPYARPNPSRVIAAPTTGRPSGTTPLESVAVMTTENTIVERNENCPSNLPQYPTLTRTPATSKSTRTPIQSSQESNGGVREPLSFEELTSLLLRITQDRQLYEKYQDCMFVVPAKMKGRHVYFNIEKKKKRRENDEKYE